MRVTSTSAYTSMRTSLATSLERVSGLQAQMGSGRRINSPSDDPVGSTTALRYRSYEADEAAWQRAADDATTRLGAADTTLQSASTTLRRVQELVVRAGNSSLSTTARAAIRDELVSLRAELHDLANTRHSGQPLFGGFAESAVALVDGAWEYSGDGGLVQRQVASGVTVTANVDGRTAFGFDAAPGDDLFSVLDRLAAAAETGDRAALDEAAPVLQARFQGVLGALGTVGATVNRVEAAKERSIAFVDQVRAERSGIEDLDLAEAILQLNQARTGYEAALGAVAKADLPSLASFLR